MAVTQFGDVRIERCHKRVRAVLAGQTVADSRRTLLVWERPYHPVYYFPRDDVRTEFIGEPTRTERRDKLGDAHLHALAVGEHEHPEGVVTYPDSPVAEIRDHLRLRWKAVDSWFEEDEEIYTHPRDPYIRIDILPSSRHIRAEAGGVTVAESHHPHLLFETGLPVRYYLPKTDVRLDLLVPSDTVTRCPYKGTAEYYSLRVGDTEYRDVAWSYRTPLPESQKIAGLVSFHDEKLDLVVDGAPMKNEA